MAAAASLGGVHGLEGSLVDEESAQDELAREGRVMPGAVALAAGAQEREAQNAPERGVEAGMTVRLAVGSTRWMLFSIGYQTLLGLTVSSLAHTGGRLLGLTGWQAMCSIYGLCVAATIRMGAGAGL